MKLSEPHIGIPVGFLLIIGGFLILLGMVAL